MSATVSGLRICVPWIGAAVAEHQCEAHSHRRWRPAHCRRASSQGLAARVGDGTRRPPASWVYIAASPSSDDVPVRNSGVDIMPSGSRMLSMTKSPKGRPLATSTTRASTSADQPYRHCVPGCSNSGSVRTWLTAAQRGCPIRRCCCRSRVCQDPTRCHRPRRCPTRTSAGRAPSSAGRGQWSNPPPGSAVWLVATRRFAAAGM